MNLPSDEVQLTTGINRMLERHTVKDGTKQDELKRISPEITQIE